VLGLLLLNCFIYLYAFSAAVVAVAGFIYVCTVSAIGDILAKLNHKGLYFDIPLKSFHDSLAVENLKESR